MYAIVSYNIEKDTGGTMLNQERVREMTKMAMFDQKDGKKCGPMIQYFRADYISKEIIKSLLSGTAAFGVIAAMAVLYYAEDLMIKINSIDIRQTVINIVLCYVVFMGVYSLITYVVYYLRYTKGRQKVKQYYAHLKKVNRLYQEEERM